MVEHRRPYLVVIRSSIGESDLHEAERALESAGVELDRSFPPVPLASDQQRVMLRGLASHAALERAKTVANVEFFPDLRVGPS
jgi:hypothetical protein